jgi:hypothetical protein
VPSVAALRTLALGQIASIEREYANLRKKLRYVEFGGTVQPDEYAEFNAKCLGLVDRISGRHDAYYLQVMRELERHPMTSDELATTLYGIAMSLKQDIEANRLVSFREYEHAALYELLLAEAEQLLDEGRKDGAAVLLGGLVVVHLRQLATKHELGVSDVADPEACNAALAQTVYGQVEQREIASWLTLWEKATQLAHGAYTHGQVTAAIQRVRVFLREFPA